VLKVKVTKRLATFTLEVDQVIEPAFACLFGPSGSGKTTTLNLLAGLATPDEGEITLHGRPLYSSRDRVNVAPQQRQIGYIFQESRLFPHLSVRQNLHFGFDLTPLAQRTFDWQEVVAASGITHLLDRNPAALSGGEKQRVALARAILAAPSYLLLDEPLAALDLSARLAFLTFLKRIHREFHLPILYVSHDLSSVINFADTLIILDKGRAIAQGKPQEHLDKLSPARLVASGDIPNVIETSIRSHDPKKGVTTVATQSAEFVLPHLPASVGESLLLNIPASEIILAVSEPTGLSASNVLSGVVARIDHIGNRVLVEVAAGESFMVEIVEATVDRLGLEPGKPVYLIIKATAFRRL